MTREQLNLRRDDIERAVRMGRTYAWLAEQWGVAHCTAHQWVKNHATDAELASLRANGIERINLFPRKRRERVKLGPRLVPSPLAKRDLAAWNSLGGAQS